MSSPPILGVDPGSNDGAAVLLSADGKTVLEYWAWSHMHRRVPCYRMTTPRVVLEYRALWLASRAIAWYLGAERGGDNAALALGLWNPNPPRYQLVIEGLFVPSRTGKLKVQEVLVLAESVGEFRAGLGYAGHLPELRPKANEWRKQVLGLSSRTPRDAAEAKAVEWATRLFAWPERTTSLTKAERGAVAEAVCIARYGWAMRKYHTGLREALQDAQAPHPEPRSGVGGDGPSAGG